METLVTGLAIGESPRWHDGRLWFSNWGTEEIVAVDERGNREVMARVPGARTYSIEWLPDGRLLVVSSADGVVRRQDADGQLVTHADLSGLAQGLNEITVDGRGNIYVNSIGFRFGEEDFKPGAIIVLTPDGTAREVADDIYFPNGMVITPDSGTLVVAESFKGLLTAFDIQPDGSLTNRRAWADFGGPGRAGDGMCMDADGAIWCTGMDDGKLLVMRVREGAEVLERHETEMFGFACMLGGQDGKTLFICESDWRGIEHMQEVIDERPGRITLLRAPAPHAGYP
jgi:sugar lactone lactonase YvrE